MDPIQRIFEESRKHPQRIVLPEGDDPRTWKAARRLVDEGLAEPLILGSPGLLQNTREEAGVDENGIVTIDPETSSERESFAEEFTRLRAHKGMTLETARETMKNVLYYGAMMVRRGQAAGGVSGSAHTTGDVIRSALQCIGMPEGIATVSSIFLMILPDERVFTFADCAIVPNPDVNQLASIAISSAGTHKALTGEEPMVAMLSFSSKGSASHEDIDKVVEALELVRQQAPDLLVDGELQVDAAIVEAVGKKKAPGSPVAGRANILIFPDLDAGNIGYKLTERLAGAQAIGPIVQGLRRPFFDLSRGCSADDIVKVCTICGVVARSLD